MLFLSLDVSDIIAALARCAISPNDVAAGLTGLASSARGAGGGRFSATCWGAGSLRFDASVSFGKSMGLAVLTGLNARGGGAASAARDGTPSAVEAANLSLNIMVGDIAATLVAGWLMTGAGSAGRTANTSLIACAALRLAAGSECGLITGSS